MKLTEHEAHSPLWKKIKEYLEETLDEQRIKNDGNLDDKQTANLRGKVALLKVLLEMDQPEPTNVAEHGNE